MNITGIFGTVRDVAAIAEFFRRTLEVPVLEAARRAEIQIGGTLLVLDQDELVDGDLHLALSIPPSSFDAAKRWLSARVPLLAVDGKDEFEAAPAWNAHSVYFEAPDGTVLELIMRRDLDTPATESFSAAGLLSVSEIGVTVPDVPATVRDVRRRAGLELYGMDRPGEQFAPVGDLNGMLILVADGRPWFPTTERVTRYRPLVIEALGAQPGTYRLTDEAQLVLRREPETFPRERSGSASVQESDG